jgi:hypothetical protein
MKENFNKSIKKAPIELWRAEVPLAPSGAALKM